MRSPPHTSWFTNQMPNSKTKGQTEEGNRQWDILPFLWLSSRTESTCSSGVTNKANNSLLGEASLPLYHVGVSASPLCLYHRAASLQAKHCIIIKCYALAVCVPACTAPPSAVLPVGNVGSRAQSSCVHKCIVASREGGRQPEKLYAVHTFCRCTK